MTRPILGKLFSWSVVTKKKIFEKKFPGPFFFTHISFRRKVFIFLYLIIFKQSTEVIMFKVVWIKNTNLIKMNKGALQQQSYTLFFIILNIAFIMYQ
jgi:hypothetical protein